MSWPRVTILLILFMYTAALVCVSRGNTVVDETTSDSPHNQRAGPVVLTVNEDGMREWEPVVKEVVEKAVASINTQNEAKATHATEGEGSSLISQQDAVASLLNLHKVPLEVTRVGKGMWILFNCYQHSLTP